MTLALVLSLSGLAAVFNGLASDVVESSEARPIEDLFDDDCVDLADASTMNTIDLDPFMQVVNVRGCDFLTYGTGVVYSGSWNDDRLVYEEYDGGDIEQLTGILDSQPVDHVQIFLLKNVTGPLPVASNAISVYGIGDTEYSQMAGMFRTYGTSSSSYRVEYHRQWWDTTDLIDMGTPQDVDAYLDVDAVMIGDRDWLVDLATEVSGTGSMYDRLNNIIGYLQSECRPVTYFAQTGSDDPVRWFLEEGKRGDREMFDTAFTLMARAIGAPARICYGYDLDTTKQIEEIRVDEWTTRSEVLFNGYGWVPFDPMPITTSGGEDERTELLYTVTGEVVNADLEGAPSIPVQLSGDGIVEIAYTDSNGEYRFDGMAEGLYDLDVIPPLGMMANASYYLPVKDSSPFTMGSGAIGVPSISIEPFEFGGDETSTVLTVVPESILRGEVFHVNGTYSDPNWYSEPSMVVIVATIDGTDRVCGALSVRNDFSIPCSLGPSLPLGPFTVRAVSLGDEWNLPSMSESYGPVTLMDTSVIEVVGPEYVIPGVEYEWTMVLTEGSTGSEVVDWSVGISHVGVDVTSYDGKRFTAIMPEGSHTLNAGYGGNETLCPTSIEWDVLAAPIELVLAPTSVQRSATTTVTAHLDSSGLPVTDEAVSIVVNGSSIGDATTDSDGGFTFELSLDDVPLDNLTVEVSVLDSVAGDHLAVTCGTELLCGSSDGMVWVRLVDDHDDPLGGKQVRLLTNDSIYLVELNEDGSATVDLDAEGGETIAVEYEGDAHHVASSNSTAFVPIDEMSMPGWLPLVLIVPSAIALSAIALRRRMGRRPPRDADDASRPGPYTLSYEGSEYGAPLTWEAGERASVTILGDDVDVVTLGTERLPETLGTVEFAVPEGRHRLHVSGPNGSGVWTVVGTRYRDEVIKEYVEAAGHIRSRVPRADGSTTPMELVASIPDLKSREGLLRATVTYERAEYSEHDIDRRDYLTVVKGLREVSV